MSSEFVVNGAPLACDCGSSSGRLSVTSTPTSIMSGQMIATISDGNPSENIPSFGQCGVTLLSCSPATSRYTWNNASPVLTAGNMSLIIGSTLPCKNGGKISVLSSGQTPMSGGGQTIPIASLAAIIFGALATLFSKIGALFRISGTILMVSGVIASPILPFNSSIPTIPGNPNLLGRRGGNNDLSSLMNGSITLFTLGLSGLGGASTFLTGVTRIVGTVLDSIGQGFVGVGQSLAGIAQSVSSIRIQTFSSPNMYCFTAGSKILCESELKNIEEIQVGDVVKSYDLICKTVIYSKVLNVFENTAIEIVLIYIDQEVIKTTRDHPFYVNGEFKRADLIKEGDLLFTHMGNKVIVIAISIKEERVKVYNFEVEESLCYFVGKTGFLVLNAC